MLSAIQEELGLARVLAQEEDGEKNIQNGENGATKSEHLEV